MADRVIRAASRIQGSLRRLGKRIVEERRGRALEREDVLAVSEPGLFVGGVTGRSGTSWLRDTLAALLRSEYYTPPELGLLDDAVLLHAGEFYYAPSAAARQRFLEHFRRYVLRVPRRRKAFGPGPPGLRESVPRRGIGLALQALEREAANAATLEDSNACFGKFYRRLLNAHSLLHGGTNRWISKEPPYARYADFLWRMVPTCRLVVMTRDGRDTALSMARKGWEGGRVIPCIERWRAITQISLEAMERLPAENLLVVSYEDMVEDQRGCVERILHFYEIEDAAGLASRVEGEGFPHRPLSQSVGRWKTVFTEHESRYFERRCGSVMARLGWRDEHSEVGRRFAGIQRSTS